MTLKNPSVNFYDSDFDSRNESITFEDTNYLNEAFIASPDYSISCILDDSSLNSPAEMRVYCDEKEYLEKIRDQKVKKLKTGKESFAEDRPKLYCQENKLKTIEVSRNESSPGSDLESYSMNNPEYLNTKEKNWVSTLKRNSMPRLSDLYSEIGNIQISGRVSDKTSDLSKNKEERTECIFTSTYVVEFQKPSEEYDWRKFQKRSFFEMDDESDEMQPKFRIPVSRSDYVYHELSTIPEVDSVFLDESVESLINLDKCDGLFVHGLKANGSCDIFTKPSNFPAYVMKLIQKEHMEKFLQEPGILEESDLTLITTDLDSLSKISDRSVKKGHSHSSYNIKRFSDEESPSLISFEQHELSCMRDCAGD